MKEVDFKNEIKILILELDEFELSKKVIDEIVGDMS